MSTVRAFAMHAANPSRFRLETQTLILGTVPAHAYLMSKPSNVACKTYVCLSPV